MSEKYQLEAAYIHNIDKHKIGETDGFPPEVAADLGFETCEQAVEIVNGRLPGLSETSDAPVGKAGATAAAEALRSPKPKLPQSQMDRFIAHQQQTYGPK